MIKVNRTSIGFRSLLVSSFVLFSLVWILLFALLIVQEKKWDRRLGWESTTDITETESNEVEIEPKMSSLSEGNVEKTASERFLSQASKMMSEGKVSESRDLPVVSDHWSGKNELEFS
jgi:hypothetical protein